MADLAVDVQDDQSAKIVWCALQLCRAFFVIVEVFIWSICLLRKPRQNGNYRIDVYRFFVRRNASREYAVSEISGQFPRMQKSLWTRASNPECIRKIRRKAKNKERYV